MRPLNNSTVQSSISRSRSQQDARRVVDEQFTVPNVSAKHRVTSEVRHLAHLPCRRARLHCTGGEPGAQAVAGIVVRFDPDSCKPFLRDQRHGPAQVSLPFARLGEVAESESVCL